MRNAMNEVTRGLRTRLRYGRDALEPPDRRSRAFVRCHCPVRASAATSAFGPTCRQIPKARRSRSEEFNATTGPWLPSEDDRAYILSLMHGVYEQGKMASWIAPPERGINAHPVDFEYVRFN